jgi:iron complex transport system permease protein
VSVLTLIVPNAIQDTATICLQTVNLRIFSSPRPSYFRDRVTKTDDTGDRHHDLIWGLVLSAIALILALGASLALGTTKISLVEIGRAFVAFNGSTEHWIARSVRLPRSLMAASVGAALAVAGALMQGITRNPLASPTLLGVNAGAAFVIVAVLFNIGTLPIGVEASLAMLGAALAAIAVYTLASFGRGGLTPLNLTLAGAALTAFFSALTTASLLLNQRAFDEIRFWLTGSIAGRDAKILVQVSPFLALGLVLALLLGRQITTLSLGESVAQGLGQQTAWVKALAVLSVVLLAGGSVAIAGPIGFVGLMTPHVAIAWAGRDYRWILPYTALWGAILLVIADIIARLVFFPEELPVGLVMPIFGAPFFLYLLNRQS